MKLVLSSDIEKVCQPALRIGLRAKTGRLQTPNFQDLRFQPLPARPRHEGVGGQNMQGQAANAAKLPPAMEGLPE